jgi:hypothetical protein
MRRADGVKEVGEREAGEEKATLPFCMEWGKMWTSAETARKGLQRGEPAWPDAKGPQQLTNRVVGA